jgi:segregation and condensation protein A
MSDELTPASDDGQLAHGYEVRLSTFEGPLDLLLHLIQQHELDIMDIPIGFITEKYVEYILLMQELNIDLASEYLVMAATLAHIKSKLLLPTPPSDQEDVDVDVEDPRAELVRRLLEYQKYKLAAEQISERSILGRDVFLRGAPGPAVEGTPPLAPVSLFKLLESFQFVLDRAKKTLDHEIEFERISITDRINQLSDVLRRKRRLSFEELFETDKSRPELIVTFLALLEMTRLRMTRLFQEGPLDPIFVELSVADEEDEDANWIEPDAPALPRGQ